MIMFIVFALAQAFAPNMESLAIIRLLLGIPLGADIAVGYTYLMESMPAGKREAMGNRWQAMFAIGEVAAILVITAMFAAGIMPEILWRVALGLGALEFSTFAFYLPILFVLVGVSGISQSNLLTLAVYCVAIGSGLVGPQIVHRIGQKRLCQYGFGIVLISLLVAGAAIAMNVLWMVPVAAAAMLWGHYWDAENAMTIPSMVAAPRYRGVAAGFGYIHTKLPQFLGIFLFPSFFNAIGPANATFFTGIFPLVGPLAATIILPEVYGFVAVRRRDTAPAAQPQLVGSA